MDAEAAAVKNAAHSDALARALVASRGLLCEDRPSVHLGFMKLGDLLHEARGNSEFGRASLAFDLLSARALAGFEWFCHNAADDPLFLSDAVFTLIGLHGQRIATDISASLLARAVPDVLGHIATLPDAHFADTRASLVIAMLLFEMSEDGADERWCVA